MALKITRAADPITVDRLNTFIYAATGLGKTSLAFTADEPLLLDFDNGVHRAANRKDAVRVNDWADVDGITPEDLAPYGTVILDTAGRALDVLTADVISKNVKHGRAGVLSQQGWGELKSRFTAFLKLLNSMGKDVVLIAHMSEEKQGDERLERLDIQGGSKAEIYKAADAMGRLVIKDGQRQLLFSPTDASFGKNPGQLPPIAVPSPASAEFDGFLGRVIRQTKDAINALTEAQRATLEEQKWFAETLPSVETAEGINALIGRASRSGEAVKAMLHARAKELGLTFPKGAAAYVAPVKDEAA